MTYSGAQASACLGQPGAFGDLRCSSLCKKPELPELIEAACTGIQRFMEGGKAELPKIGSLLKFRISFKIFDPPQQSPDRSWASCMRHQVCDPHVKRLWGPTMKKGAGEGRMTLWLGGFLIGRFSV
jgi:hypothetical protein